jgi:hypothetical protein
MTLVMAILLVVLVFSAYRLADDYVRRSMGSFDSAARVWTDLDAAATELLNTDLPESVGRMVVALTRLAGCGCFVRGVLLSNYLPRAKLQQDGRGDKWNDAFNDLKVLNGSQKDCFDRLLSLVIVYDSFRNPLQGWLFRRLLRSFTQDKRSYREKAEAELAALSVLSNRKPLTH